MGLRHSYSGLMKQPVFSLLDRDRKLVATVRARNHKEAINLFKKADLKGLYVTTPRKT